MLAILSLLLVVWVVAGIRYLVVELIENSISRDAQQLHDTTCQGIAVADSMCSSEQWNWIRRLKIGAIWLEWPSFTLTMLRVFLIKAGQDVKSIDTWTQSILLLFLSMLILVCIVMKTSAKLKRYVDPIIFDFSFIALTMVCTRVALCINGAGNLTLPDGSTCERLDRYPYFAVVGTVGFLGIYIGGLRYRAQEQHHSDIRFQSSFQITMVLVRACKYISYLLKYLSTHDQLKRIHYLPPS